MSTDISRISEIAGFIGACLVDGDTGLMLTSIGGRSIDLEAAAAAATGVVKAQTAAIEALNLDDRPEEMLISLGRQIHILRSLRNNPGVFLLVVLDRSEATLGLARLQTQAVEADLGI